MAQSPEFERLDQAGHGVERRNVAIALRHLRQGVDHWGGVHKELHAEGQQHAQVSIFGGHGGDHQAEPQAHTRKQEHQHGEKQ